MTEKEAFEAWAQSEPRAWLLALEWSADVGAYHDSDAEVAWRAWQAATTHALDEAEAACRKVPIENMAPTVVQYCEAICKLKSET